MENNISPNEAKDREDYTFGALVFAKALHHILKEGMGVAIEIEESEKHSSFPESTKFIVYSLNGTIQIEPATQPLEPGEVFNVLDWQNNL
jgi:hypothetical protein